MTMRDPHVVALLYNAKALPGFIYHEPGKIEAETDDFKIRLADWKLRIEPKDHFASPEELQPLADVFVRSWSIASGLDRGFPEISFEYETAEVIDRVPPPPGVIEGHGRAVLRISSSASGTVRVGPARNAYPQPPIGFAASPTVETLWNRYQGYLRGSEPLPAMAYFCFTVVNSIAGGAKKASTQFAIASSVFNKLSELSSTRGDASDARKIDARQPTVALSQPERRWLDSTIREIIKRVGQEAAGLRPKELKMSDLPPLVSPKKP
jgi:hypothetical protein